MDDWVLPSRGIVGMACLIVAESAIFIIFIVAYMYYLGKSLTGPTPREVLELPILSTICLLVEQHHRSLRRFGAASRQARHVLALACCHRPARQHLSRRHSAESGIN